MGLPSKDEAVNVLTEYNAPGVANLDDNVTIANMLTAATSAPRTRERSRRPDERQAEAAAGLLHEGHPWPKREGVGLPC
jgi:hypothetical protein